MNWIVLGGNDPKTGLTKPEAIKQCPKGWELIGVEESVRLMKTDKKYRELMTRYWCWCLEDSDKSPKEVFGKEKWAKNVCLSDWSGKGYSFGSSWGRGVARPGVGAFSPLDGGGVGVAVFVKSFSKKALSKTRTSKGKTIVGRTYAQGVKDGKEIIAQKILKLIRAGNCV